MRLARPWPWRPLMSDVRALQDSPEDIADLPRPQSQPLHRREIDGNAKIVRKLLAEPNEFASFAESSRRA